MSNAQQILSNHFVTIFLPLENSKSALFNRYFHIISQTSLKFLYLFKTLIADPK